MQSMRPQAMSRDEAIEEASSWTSADVVELLRKNGVEEPCWKAAEKRQIDGDELLHLTEGKLALWKSDLTKPLTRKLWAFVEELKKHPEKYVEQRHRHQQPTTAAESHTVAVKCGASPSDVSSWDTDFDDEEDESSGCNGHAITPSIINSDEFLSRLRLFQENDRVQRQRTESLKGSNFSLNRMERTSNGGAAPTPRGTSAHSNAPPTPETTYANCQSENFGVVEENTYMNCACEVPPLRPGQNKSGNLGATNQQQKSLAEKLREQLMLLDVRQTSAVAPRSGDTCKARDDAELRAVGEPRPSFLHRRSKIEAGFGRGDSRSNGVSKHQKAPSSEPSFNGNTSVSHTPQSSCSEESLRNLPRPPASIQSFDLVASLPSTTATQLPSDNENDDEDDEDAFDGDDEESYESFDQRLVAEHNGAVMLTGERGPGNKPLGSAADDEGLYEIYESIIETPEDDKEPAKTSHSNTSPSKVPPPLPAKAPRNLAERSSNQRSTPKQGASSPGATRGSLPLPPDPCTDRPWFHNLTREQAIILMEQHKTDGCFLLRPSTTNPDNPMTLVLWFKDKVYNIPVRRRPDNKYALGTPKSEEQAFDSIDDIVPHFKSESLILFSGGVEMGCTMLTDTPSK